MAPSLPPGYVRGKWTPPPPDTSHYYYGDGSDPKKANPAPWSQDLLTGGQVEPKGAAAAKIMAMQAFLNHRGYKIAEDGVRGPETNAAVVAFHSHIDPQKWSSRNNPPVAVRPGGPGAHGNGTDVPSSPPVTPKTPSGASTGTVAATTDPAIPNIDPYGYASAATGAEYDPQISQLARNISMGGAQGKQNQSDILNWYKQLQTLQANMGARNQDAAQTNIGNYNDASNTTLSQLFGGAGASSSADEAAAFHDIQAGGMQANAASQSGFDNDMRAILAAQQSDASRSQLNKDQNAQRDLASQMVSLKGARGKAYTTNLTAGIQAATQQQSALTSLDLAKQMVPYQIAQAKAATTQATAGATNAKALADANLKLINAKVASLGTAGNWDLTKPQQRGALGSALRTGLQTADGTFRIDPVNGWKNIQLALQQAGLTGNADAQAFAKSIFEETMNNSHAKHMWGGFSWDGNNVGRSGKHYDKKTGKLVSGQVG